MTNGFRIIVRGVLSVRFCSGFDGLSGRVADDYTVLEALPGAAPRLAEVLRRLENLGLEVLAVERAAGAVHDTEED